MPNVITGKIDVTKITKSRLFEGKNGAKYLDFVLIPTTNSRYDDDFMVCESVSKEEKAQGVRGQILGNAKILAARQPRPQTSSTEYHVQHPSSEGDDTQIPF